MSMNQVVVDDDTLEIVAWVSYVQSLNGRGYLRVTDAPNWVSETQKKLYLVRAHEIFAAVETHRKPVERLDSTERPITSSDVNKAGAAKANALWGGS